MDFWGDLRGAKFISRRLIFRVGGKIKKINSFRIIGQSNTIKIFSLKFWNLWKISKGYGR